MFLEKENCATDGRAGPRMGTCWSFLFLHPWDGFAIRGDYF